MNFPTAAVSYLQASLAVLCMSEFHTALRFAEVSQSDPRLQSRELPGVADMKVPRSTPPQLDLRTDRSTGVLLKKQLQTETLTALKNLNYCQAGGDRVYKARHHKLSCAFYKMKGTVQ